MFKLIRSIPLMAVVLVLYNFLGLTNGAAGQSFWSTTMFNITMPSKAVLSLTYGHIFIAFALIILLIEILKSTNASDVAMIEQMLSVLAFVAFLVQLLISARAAEPTFFILLLISMVEMLAGFVVLIKVSKRDIAIG